MTREEHILFDALDRRHLEEIERLREALRPFAEHFDWDETRFEQLDDEDFRATRLKVGDVRRARAALSRTEQSS